MLHGGASISGRQFCFQVATLVQVLVGRALRRGMPARVGGALDIGGWLGETRPHRVSRPGAGEGATTTGSGRILTDTLSLVYASAVDPDTEARSARIVELRGAGFTPKQIARALGLPPHQVALHLRQVAQLEGRSEPPRAEAECWISAGWSQTVDASRLGYDPPDPLAHATGLVGIVVARPRVRVDRISVCGYLVDAYCLGVKDSMGPLFGPRAALPGFLERFFGAFEGDPESISPELARQVVFGSVSFAAQFGFRPHPDFTRTRSHLGEPPDRISVGFGLEGRPFYIQGPFDDPQAVLSALSRRLGDAGQVSGRARAAPPVQPFLRPAAGPR